MLSFNTQNLIKKSAIDTFVLTLTDGYDFHMSIPFMDLKDLVSYLVKNLDDSFDYAKSKFSKLDIRDNSLCNLAEVQRLCNEFLDNGVEKVVVTKETQIIY